MNLENYIRDIPDFPQEGIIFKDISPLLSDPLAFSESIDLLVKNIDNIDVIVWLDARGFIFGWALAYKLWLPFVPVRKKWKLPYDTISIDYDLEYGKNTFEIHTDAIKQWQKVVIIDDLLATGWTALAACKLVEELWWIVESIEFVIELSFLQGSEKLKDYKINSLLKY